MQLSRIVFGLGIALMFASLQDASAQTYTGAGGCNKSLFWPFVREPGDCLTDAERARGMTGTYRGNEVQQEPEVQQQAETVQTPPSDGESELPRAPAVPPASSSVGNLRRVRFSV